MSRRSLRNRFLVFSLPFTLVIVLIVIIGSYLSFSARMHEELGVRSQLLIGMLAGSDGLRLALLSSDKQLAHKEILRAIKLDPLVDYIIVLSDSGEVLTAEPGAARGEADGTFRTRALIKQHGSRTVTGETVVHSRRSVVTLQEEAGHLEEWMLGEVLPQKKQEKSIGEILIALDGRHAFLQRILPVLLIGVLLPIAMMIIIGLTLTRVLRRLNSVVDYARTIATGNLSKRMLVDDDDEIGELATAMNRMTVNLSDVLARATAVGDELLNVTVRIGDSAVNVTQGSRQQWSAIEQTRGELDEMNRTLRELAKNVEAISKWTRESSEDARQIGERNGDVTLKLQQLGQSNQSLSASVEQVASNVAILARHVDVLGTAANDTEQAIERTGQSMRSTRESAEDSARQSAEVFEEARGGALSLGDALGVMKQLEEAMGEVRGATGGLTDGIETVGAFLRGISDVARRTNLLSLNAAIIASQAGEHGRQFQVVAEEVKALASQTAGLTRDIESVLEEIGGNSQHAHTAVDRASEHVNNSSHQVRVAGQVLRSLQQQVQLSSAASREIAETMAAREGDLGQVTQAMEHVVAVTGEIHKVTQNQLQAVGIMRESATTIQDVSDAVHHSTAEQLEGSARIGRVLADISENVRHLANSQDSQVLGSERILGSMEQIMQAAEQSRDEAQTLSGATDVLSLQAEELRSEMKSFVLSKNI